MNTQEFKLRSRVLSIAVAAALPFALASNVFAGCVEGSSIVNCTGTIAGFRFNAEAPNSPTDFTFADVLYANTVTNDVNSKTITIKDGAIVNAADAVVEGTFIASKGKAGIFILNGEEDEVVPVDINTVRPSNLVNQTYDNEGTKVVIERGATIDVTGDVATSGYDLNTSGIYMDGSNNTVNNYGEITVRGAANTAHNGVIFTGDDANNFGPTLNNHGNIKLLQSNISDLTTIQAAVNFKESIIEGVLNNHGLISAGFADGIVGTSKKTIYGIYSDDNAQNFYINNFDDGVIKVDQVANPCHSDGTSTNATCNAAIYSRAYNTFITNEGTITGDVKTRDTNHGLMIENSGLIDGYLTRQVRENDTNLYNTRDANNQPEVAYTTYLPVIKKGGGNTAEFQVFNNAAIGSDAKTDALAELVEISGFISGRFDVLQYRPTTNSINHVLTIQPKVDGAIVHKNDEYQLTGENLVIGNNLKNADGSLALEAEIDNKSALVTWEISSNDAGGNPLAIKVADVKSSGQIAGISAQSGSVLDTLLAYNGNSADLNKLGSDLINLESDSAVIKAADQLRPEINGAQFQALINVQDRVSGLVDSRLGDTHLAAITGKSGIATGNSASNTGVWFQGFGGKGDQDRRNNIDGYNTNTYGFALGADQQLGDGSLRVGGVLSYGQSAINAQGSNTGNRSNIDSYQGTVYASKLLDGWYLNGSLGLGNHSFDTKRVVLANSVAGNFDAWQYSAKLDAGYPVNLGKFTLVPLAGLAYSHLTQDGYTESGLGALNVNGRDTNSLRSGVGAKGIVSLYEGDIKAKLELRAIWNHEFADTAQDTTARFAAGGSSFTTSGISPERDSANLGASLRLVGENKTMQQSVNLSYDAEIKNQYQSHTASLQARFDF